MAFNGHEKKSLRILEIAKGYIAGAKACVTFDALEEAPSLLLPEQYRQQLFKHIPPSPGVTIVFLEPRQFNFCNAANPFWIKLRSDEVGEQRACPSNLGHFGERRCKLQLPPFCSARVSSENVNSLFERDLRRSCE